MTLVHYSALRLCVHLCEIGMHLLLQKVIRRLKLANVWIAAGKGLFLNLEGGRVCGG